MSIPIVSSPAPANAESLRLEAGQFELSIMVEEQAILAAAKDLADNFHQILGTSPKIARGPGHFSISLDSALAPETFIIDINQQISIRGADTRGVIYDIYEFSHRFLGFDPCWFWRSLIPPSRESIDIPFGSYTCPPPVFQYRGWFINDEDLLGRWKKAVGQRFMNWPRRAETLNAPDDDYEKRLLGYYTPVVDAGVMERVYESALRSRANFIIPASFVDIMNEPEAELVRAALRRGLMVSQHHVEPLGVSHFAYETWWSEKDGSLPPFSYREAPEQMRECWEAYARRWNEIAGDQIIWQTGLRGRGDRALWHHDPDAKETASQLVSAALEDQSSIIRQIDPRPAPPATLTLWDEGVQLLHSGLLQVPAETILIFADHARSQEMQEDFQTFPREPERDHGFYYHVAVWPWGPHLVQGPAPSKIARTVCQVENKGDTRYALLNVCNVRDHVMGIDAWSRQVWEPEPWTDEEFLRTWLPESLVPLYMEFLAAIPEMENGWMLYDGTARALINSHMGRIEAGASLEGTMAARYADRIVKPGRHSDRLAGLLSRLRTTSPPAGYETFFRTNLVAQVEILLGLYRCLEYLYTTPANLKAAATSIEFCLHGFRTGAQGEWTGWYDGDKKFNLAGLASQLHKLSAA